MTINPSWLRAGDLMFGPIGGVVPGVFPVGAGQIMVAPWKTRLTWRTWWRIRHAATVTQSANWDMKTPPMIAQAMPSGFEEVPLGSHRWTSDYVFVRPPYAPGQAEAVAEHGLQMAMRKVPYGSEDFAAIAAHRAHLPVPHLDEFIARVDEDGYPLRSICSQAVDAQLTLAGFHPFTDGRLPQDVVPAELYLRLITTVGSTVIRPGSKAVQIKLPQMVNNLPGHVDVQEAMLAQAVACDLL